MALMKMNNYESIRATCLEDQRLTSEVIDNFLIYYAAQQSNLHREVTKKAAKYRHITKELPDEWVNMFKTQYIGHRIFSKDGLIKKYINHSGLNHLTDKEIDFLQFQKEHPWRYSFAWITERPAPDFFQMEDAFINESYLLFSPSMSKVLSERNIGLWFNLITTNGVCHQSYGPISAFTGFEPNDIQFFATELNRGEWFEDGIELMQHVEQNPVPYMMLISGSTLPLTFHKDHQLVQATAEFRDDLFDPDDFKNHFKAEYSHGVYRFSLDGWDHYPHHCTVYFNEDEKLLTLYSMTDTGFRKLVETMNQSGYQLPYEPEQRVNLAMLSTAGDILKKDVHLGSYTDLFKKEISEDEQAELDKMNAFLNLLIPYINEGGNPNLETLAAEAGIDIKIAEELYQQAKKSVE